MNKYEYLQDRAFLKALDTSSLLTQYVKISVLDKDDMFLASIEGKATGGNISLNGKSAVRRTANLTMVADENNYQITKVDNLLSMNKKVELEIGIENNTNQYQQYPILWFSMGVYAITSASTSHGEQGINISLNLKDKMVLLNGEQGGTLPAVVELNRIDIIDSDGNIVTKDILMRELIYSLVSAYGEIPSDKIVIDDLDTRVKNLVRWVSTMPVYIIKPKQEGQSFIFTTTQPPESEDYEVFGFNDNIGYQYTDYIYPISGGLTANLGDSVASILEKIKNATGNYEFFFDLDGVFHFQAIKNFLNEGSAIDNLTDAINDKYLINTNTTEKSVYTFENSIGTAFTNSPQYQQIKNEYIVWGQLSGSKQVLRYHLAIDTPPAKIEGKDYYGVYNVSEFQISVLGIKTPIDVKQGAGAAGRKTIYTADWRTELYYNYLATGNKKYYSEELVSEWPKVYDVENQHYIEQAPDRITYFFDMLDPNEIDDLNIAQLNIGNIGRRTKVIQDTKINCLIAPTPPDYCYIKAGQEDTDELREECIARGENFVQIAPRIMDFISLGTTANSAYDLLRSELHSLVSYNEAITISCVPIYHLEPNVRITVNDEESGIKGDYIINSMSIPLASNGKMSISASRAIERI